MGYYGGLILTGENQYENFGTAISKLGDVNGDGIEDFAVGLRDAGFYGENLYIVYGSDTGLPAFLDSSELDGTNGFAVNFQPYGEYSYYGDRLDVSNLGDVNGDGIDDIGIASVSNYNNYNYGETTAFVLLGSDTRTDAELTVNPDIAAADGFQVLISDSYNVTDFGSAGDVNGDGFDDLLINGSTNTYGFYGYGEGNYYFSGGNSRAYVVFGTNTIGATGPVDATSLDGTDGFFVSTGQFDFAGGGGELGGALPSGGVRALGDVNGDGFDDLGLREVTSRIYDDPILDNEGNELGRFAYDSQAFILLGTDVEGDGQKVGFVDGISVRWDDLSTGQVADSPYDFFGSNDIDVRGIGDFNGDGFDDVAIFTTNRNLPGEWSPVAEDGDDARGTIGIIFGGPDGVDTDGTGPEDGLEDSVSLAAVLSGTTDLVNEPDVLIVDSSANSNGFFDRYDGFGSRVEAAGDVNGDGIDDLLISVPRNGSVEIDGPDANGEVFLVFGRDEDAGDTFPTVLDLDNLTQAEKDTTFYRFVQDQNYSGFANAATAAGDINGDGFDDIIINRTNPRNYQLSQLSIELRDGEAVPLVALPPNNGGAFVVFGGVALEAVDNADGANDNTINVNNLPVDVITGALPIQVSVASFGFTNRVLEGDSGTTILPITVQRTGDLTEAVSFDWSVEGTGFTPADGDDFVGGALPFGTTDFASGEAFAIVELEVSGDVDIESSDDFLFTIDAVSNTGPSPVSIGVSSTQGEIINDDFPARITMFSSNAIEGDDMVFTVRRSGQTTTEVEVDFSVSGGSFRPASASDVANVTADGVSLGGGLGQFGTITFASGEIEKTIVVQTAQDDLIENSESVRVNLSNISSDGAAELGTTSRTSYILNDDFAPEILVQGGGRFNEGSTPGGFTDVTFQIVRRGETDGVTEVTYDLNPVPFQGDFFAADSNDVDGFLPLFGQTVRFEDGETVQEVTVQVIHDGVIEPRESFELRITQVDSFNGVSYTVVNSAATATINNDDGRPPVIPPGVEADVFGDPHIVTLDGLGYDFQAVGEYVLVESTIPDDPRDFSVQVRFEPLPGSDLVSVTTRMAVNIGDDLIEIDALGSDPLLINGVAPTPAQLALLAIDVNDDTFADVFFNEDQSEFFIVLNDLGEQLMVKNVGGVLNVCVFLADDVDDTGAPTGGHANNVTGLMGNADGDTTNDLMLRDGSQTFVDPTFEELYVTYADSWKLITDERLFSDPEGTGEFPADFPAAKISIDDLPASVLAAAEAAVDAAGISDPIIRESAILDFALTGDDNFVQGALGLAATPTVDTDVTDAPETPLTIGVNPLDTVVSEADGDPNTLTFNFWRIGDDSADVVIDYAIGGDVDAADLVDGTALTGQVTIEAGSDSATLQIGVSNDDTTELDEKLTVSITGNDSGALIASASGTTLIETDDFAPIAQDDAFSADANELIDGNLLVGNPELVDEDANEDVLTVISAVDSSGNAITVGGTTTLTSGAEVTLQANGDFTYDASNSAAATALGQGELGEDSFTYTISDGNGGTDSATVSISLDGVNDAPVAVDDEFSIDEGEQLTVSLRGNDFDVDAGDEIKIISANGVVIDESFNPPALGFEIVSAGGRTAQVGITETGALDFILDQKENFEDLGAGESDTISFTYEIMDVGGLTDTATVDVTVDGANDAPVLAAVGPFDVLENTTDVGVISATDVEMDTLTYDIIGGDDADLFSIDATTGALSFKAAPDYEAEADENGDNTYEVQVSVSDGDLSDEEFVFVNVTDEEEVTGPNPVVGGNGSDNLIGTDDSDLIQGNGGPFDIMTGLGGADVFEISVTTGNGMELSYITDYEAGIDAIDLGSSTVLSSLAAGGATYLYLNYSDFDIVVVQGAASVDDITFV